MTKRFFGWTAVKFKRKRIPALSSMFSSSKHYLLLTAEIGIGYFTSIPTSGSWSEPSHLGVHASYHTTVDQPLQQGNAKPMSPDCSSSTGKRYDILSPTVSSTVPEVLVSSLSAAMPTVLPQHAEKLMLSGLKGAQVAVNGESYGETSGVYFHSDAVNNMPVAVGIQPVSPGSSDQGEAQHCGVSSTNSVSSSRKRKVDPKEKDDGYYVKRRKNNESAKRSRENRRVKETMVKYENAVLKADNQRLQGSLSLMEHMVIQTESTCLKGVMYDRRIPINALHLIVDSNVLLQQELWGRLRKIKRDMQQGPPLPAHQSHFQGPPPPPPPPPPGPTAGTV